MPTIYDLKPAFQNLLRPLTAWLAARGVSANQVTLAALVLSLATGAALACSGGARWTLALVPPVLFVRMALNAIDGMLAREHDMKTSLGAVLNELGDVISDSALYAAFALVPGLSAPWVVAVVLLAMLTEMTGVVAVQIGASRRYDGPMGKSDRAFLFGALALAGALGLSLAGWSDWLLGAVCILLVLTVFNRARAALAEVA